MALPKKGVGSDFTILNCNNLCSHSVSSESVSVQPVAEPLFAVQSGPGSVYRAAHSHSREGANKRGNSSRLTQSFHFFSLSRFFLPQMP